MAHEAGASTEPHVRFRMLSVPVVSWALYDFANTIFSFAVITTYFNEWMIEDRGTPDVHISLMGFVVGVALLLTMPPLGAIADRYGRRRPFLIGFTLLSVASTAALGLVDAPIVALVVAGVAIFGFQSAIAHYDPLLADVAPRERHGRVSGLGVGLGYLGALTGALVLLQVVGEGDKQQAFLPTAAMYLLFSLPLFLFVRERGRPADAPPNPPLATVSRQAMRQLAVTARRIRADYRPVARFLLARFLYVDALAVVLTYMTVYMSRVGDFSQAQKTTVLGLSMVIAAIGAFVAGGLVERYGPRRVLTSVLVLFAATLLLAAGTGSAALVWVLGPMVGVGLGAVWTSDRVFMMRLSPPDVRGEFFGLYNLVGKLSSGVGPVLFWGLPIYVLHDRTGWWSSLDASRAALAVLACVALAGMWLVRGVSDEPHDAPLVQAEVAS